MSTKSGILSVFSGTYQVTQKGAVSTLPQLRFQHCFLFSFAFYRNRNSRRGEVKINAVWKNTAPLGGEVAAITFKRTK